MINQDFSQLADVSLHKMQILFSDKTIAKISLGLAVLILLCSAYGMVSFGKNFSSWQLPDPELYQQKIAVTEASTTRVENKHLFGKVTKAGATLANAIKSNLSLSLKGVMNEADPKMGAAIITGPDGVDKNYHVGDKLPIDNATVTLEYIYKDKVYIKNNDTIEYLLYPKLEFKNQPHDRANGGNQFLPITQDNGSRDAEVENVETMQEKQTDDEDVAEPVPPPPPSKEADKVSGNHIDNKFNRFNRFNRRYNRNYN